MLDGIINEVKEYAQKAIQGSSDIADDKKDLALQTTSDTIVESIKDLFAGDGNILDKAKDLLSNEGGFLENLKDKISVTLSDKVGLDASQVDGFVSTLIPQLKQVLSDKINLDNFSFDSIIDSITEENGSESTSEKVEKGGLFGLITRFFKK